MLPTVPRSEALRAAFLLLFCCWCCGVVVVGAVLLIIFVLIPVFLVSSLKLFCFWLFSSSWPSSCVLVLFCVVFANELLVVFVLGEVALVVGSFVAVVGLFSAVVAVVSMRLLETASEKFCESSVLLVRVGFCWVLLLSDVNVVDVSVVVVLILMYLFLVVCFVVVVVVVSPVVSTCMVVMVFAEACAYLWWLLWLWAAAVVGCLWLLYRRLRL